MYEAKFSRPGLNQTLLCAVKRGQDCGSSRWSPGRLKTKDMPHIPSGAAVFMPTRVKTDVSGPEGLLTCFCPGCPAASGCGQLSVTSKFPVQVLLRLHQPSRCNPALPTLGDSEAATRVVVLDLQGAMYMYGRCPSTVPLRSSRPPESCPTLPRCRAPFGRQNKELLEAPSASFRSTSARGTSRWHPSREGQCAYQDRWTNEPKAGFPLSIGVSPRVVGGVHASHGKMSTSNTSAGFCLSSPAPLLSSHQIIRESLTHRG